MKRLFFATTLMILAVGVGWRVAPPEARERLLGFVGMANRADPARIVQDIKEKITPEDSVARRVVLVETLKQKVQEIKTKAAVGENTDGASAGVPAPSNANASAAARAADIASSADEAVQIITQLEQSGGGTSAGGQIVQRLIERILPAPQCKP